MAECCVSLRRVSGSATQVSSLGSSNTRFSLESSGETTVAVTSVEQEEQQEEEEPPAGGTTGQWEEEEDTAGEPMENVTGRNETSHAQEASEGTMETAVETEESDEAGEEEEKLNSGK